MRTWAICNQKGGVGKTTTAVCLASLLAEQGQRVVLIDLDPHASASVYLAGHEHEGRAGVMQWFGAAIDGAALDEASVAAACEPTPQPGLSIVRATPALAALERRCAGKEGFGRVLTDALAKLGRRFDYALVDCPPTLGLLMVNALAAADRVLIPVQTEHLALEGLRRMLATLQMIEQSQRRQIERLVIPTLFDRRTRAGVLALAQLREEHASVVWPEPVPIDTRLRDATRANLPAPMHSPDSRAVAVYRRLVDRLTDAQVHPQRDSEGRRQRDPHGSAQGFNKAGLAATASLATHGAPS